MLGRVKKRKDKKKKKKEKDGDLLVPDLIKGAVRTPIRNDYTIEPQELGRLVLFYLQVVLAS